MSKLLVLLLITLKYVFYCGRSEASAGSALALLRPMTGGFTIPDFASIADSAQSRLWESVINNHD